MQPPPRGCVLKPNVNPLYTPRELAAASARLCVETFAKDFDIRKAGQAAASARLCVETNLSSNQRHLFRRSRLRAAVC